MKFVALFVLGLSCAVATARAAEPITLASAQGAVAVLTEGNTGWRVSVLQVPGGPEGGLAVQEREREITTEAASETLPRGWSLVEATAERVVLEQNAAEAGVQLRRVLSFGPAVNILRIETLARSREGTRTLLRIPLLDVAVAGEEFRETGQAPASFPLFGNRLFAGIEHVSGEAKTTGEIIELVQRPRLTVGGDWTPVATVVLGWPVPGAERGLPEGSAMRVGFLNYLDSVRVKPERMVLHSETWWTMMPPLTEKGVLEDIEALKRGFLDRTGMFFDTYCLDLGWSDPRTFWQIADARFPEGFKTINDRLGGLGTKLGLWMSPGSGYPDGLSNAWLEGQGYEMTPFPDFPQGVPCFALGTRYQREFRERLVGYARQYGLGHVILDFMAQRCDVEGHGHPVGLESRYAIDAGVADVLDALRAVNPQIALEPMVCGYPPSPWWLMKTPFILGPAGDDVPFGRGPSPEWMESMITARDVAYRTGQDAWLMPTQALETWDLVVQTPGEFENTAVMAIGRGRWFLSSYIKPSLMKPEDWDFFAALVRWARANKEHLGNAWQIGGKPENREAYGYMFRGGAKDLFCVRNPWIEERTIEVPASPLATEARELRMIYPRRATIARLEPGAVAPTRVVLGPYETVFLETVPATEETTLSDAPGGVRALLTAGAPLWTTRDEVEPGREFAWVRYAWSGALTMPDVEDGELCVLVEGVPAVEHAACEVMIGGQAVKPRRSGSAGQFGAAIDASPENWLWFIVPVAKGQTAFHIDVRAPTTEVAVGVYLRGNVVVASDGAPDGGAAFPVFRPGRKPWSQTLTPLRRLDASDER